MTKESKKNPNKSAYQEITPEDAFIWGKLQGSGGRYFISKPINKILEDFYRWLVEQGKINETYRKKG